jgi:short-subunit dehydrogenase
LSVSREGQTREFFRDKVALITGASSGIGAELAWQLSQHGSKLALTARRVERLEALAMRIEATGQTKPIALACDVSRDGDLERAVAATSERWGRLDIVVANAGFGVVGDFARLSVDDYRRQFETNVFGVLRTIYAALPEIQKARGNIVVIGSVAGWVATPGSSPYAMSKFALRALAEAIRRELRPSGVTVTLISPGFVESDIRRVDNFGQVREGARDPLPSWLTVRTDKAVRQMLAAVANGKREAIITGHGKILVALERFAPWVLRALLPRRPSRTP